MRYFSLILISIAFGSQGCSTGSSKRHPAAATDSAPGSYPITVSGGDEKSFTPDVSGPSVLDPREYDVVVVGAGLSGITASLYLSDRGKSVLLLEKEKALGGLASWTDTHSGARYDRGAAYWTDPYVEELKILKHIGLGNFEKKYPIPEPIDSYLWNGKNYAGVWDTETLKELPASFELFKQILTREQKAGLIPDQPLEEGVNLELDDLSAKQWIQSMPERAKQETDDDTKRIYVRFQKEIAEGKLLLTDPMRDVIDFLDLYCRSALGAASDKVSAVAFANFYESEIITRYTTPMGTGKAANLMINKLKKRPLLVTLETQTPVGKVITTSDHVEVLFLKDGKTRRVKAKYVVFAAQLKFASKLIEGFSEHAPDQVKLINELAYAHYSVHAIEVKGHPYRASYDTWVKTPESTEEDFTDFILGRWMDPKIRGYEGMKDFSRDPKDTRGIFSIYQPLSQQWVGRGYTEQQATDLARRSVDGLVHLIGPTMKEKWGTHFDIVNVETNRWPFSVHVATPGHFRHKAKMLRKPYGRIYFAHSNLGTPAFEEALFRGHCAANNILKAIDHNFRQEKWTHCPIDSLEISH